MILRTGSKGFLLFEVVIALAILSSAIVLVIRGFMTSMKAIAVSEDNIKAVRHLEEKMWEIEDEAAKEGTLTTDSSSGNFDDGYKWALSVDTVKDNDNLKFVKLIVNDRSLVTYIKAKDE